MPHPPVTDWATDFDHTDDAWAADPYPIWDELRERRARSPTPTATAACGCRPATRTSPPSPTTPSTSRRAASSSASSAPPIELAPEGIAPPISSDPPFHHDARRMLLPVFSPQAIDKLEPSTRAYCHELLDAARRPGRRRRRRRVRPAHPGAGDRQHARPARGGRRPVPRVRAPRARGRGPAARGAERRDRWRCSSTCRATSRTTSADPRDDLITLPARVRDRRREARRRSTSARTIALLLIAGIDTTWSAIGASLWHLAQHPGDRQRLVDEPDAAADRDRGAAPGLRAGDDGPPGEGGHGLQRLPDEGRRLGAAAVPGGQPRPRGLRPGRRGRHRPRAATATPPSASASTAAPARTWPAWSCGSRSRSGSTRFPDFDLADPDGRALVGRPGPRAASAAPGGAVDAASASTASAARATAAATPGPRAVRLSTTRATPSCWSTGTCPPG